jgi:hypothetical protein
LKIRLAEQRRNETNTPRPHSHKRGFLTAIAVAIPAMLIGAGVTPPAQAGYVVTLAEVGPNVVATGSGAIDLTDLGGRFCGCSGGGGAAVVPVNGAILTGPAGNTTGYDVYNSTIITGPSSIGSGTGSAADIGSGDIVGILSVSVGADLFVPFGYVSGHPLSDSATYDSQTFSSLGVTPGTYAWNWGSGADADSFTLHIEAVAAPAPLIGHGMPVLLAVGGMLLFGANWLERSKRHGLQVG